MKKKLPMLFLTAAVLLVVTGAGLAQGNQDPQGENSVLPPLVSERYEYHKVCGCCEKDIQCDMVDKAIRWKDGNDYDSITNWKVKWDYGYKRGSGYCAADAFRITLDVVIQLPKWVCSGNAPQSLKDKWGSFIQKLTAHENVHRDLARKAADDLTKVVAGMPPARTCRELDQDVETLCWTRLQVLDAEQAEFDATNGHGFADGPSFP